MSAPDGFTLPLGIALIWFATCVRCGAAVVIDAANDIDSLALHRTWHGDSDGVGARVPVAPAPPALSVEARAQELEAQGLQAPADALREREAARIRRGAP